MKFLVIYHAKTHACGKNGNFPTPFNARYFTAPKLRMERGLVFIEALDFDVFYFALQIVTDLLKKAETGAAGLRALLKLLDPMYTF